ncbi:hypothetical protein GCM10027442_20970 [Emticicia fontis]
MGYKRNLFKINFINKIACRVGRKCHSRPVKNNFYVRADLLGFLGNNCSPKSLAKAKLDSGNLVTTS